MKFWGSSSQNNKQSKNPPINEELQRMIAQALHNQQIQQMIEQQRQQQLQQQQQTQSSSNNNVSPQSYGVEQSQDQDQSEYSQSFISTTAGGDGLEFDKRFNSIFEEIENIKSASVVQKVNEKELDDIPDNLSPLSYLIEAVQQLESLKRDVQETNQKEEEYLQIIKAMKYDHQILTCSHTLNLLMKSYKQLAEINDSNQDKIDGLQRENFKLSQDITQFKIDKSLMQSQIISMQDELNIFIEENQRIKRQLEMMRRQREEQNSFEYEENKKVILDTQVYKDKADKYKAEVFQLKKKLRKLEKMENLYEKLKIKDNEREEQEIQKKAQLELKRQKELKSLLGHLKVYNSFEHNAKFEMQLSIFSMETFSFLEEPDIMKLTCLNKKYSGVFLKYNTRLFLSIFNNKTIDLNSKLKDSYSKCEMQEAVIKRIEAQEKIKASLVQDTSEERMRYILEKHIVRPRLLQQQKFNNLNSVNNQGNPTIGEMEKTLRQTTVFMATQYEQVKQSQYQQAKEHEESSMKQQQVQQQMHQQQQQNLSQSTVDSNIISDSSASSKQGSYKIVKGAKKIVGALSYFGGFKAAVKKPEEQQNPSQDQQEHIPPSQMNDDLITVDNSSSAGLLDNPKETNPYLQHNQPVESHENQIENMLSQQVQEFNKKESGPIKQQEAAEEQKQAQTHEPKHTEITHSSNPIGTVSSETLRTLDQVNTLDDMNDLLFQIGSFLVSDKQKLAQWIRSIQECFAEFFILSKHLYVETIELDVLKDFLVTKVDSLKTRVQELLNEKEDMSAIHQSDSSIKEHLIQKLNDLEQANMERSTELLFTKRKLQHLEDGKSEYESKVELYQNELSELRSKAQKEIKQLREKASTLSEDNVTYKKALSDMMIFFNKIESI